MLAAVRVFLHVTSIFFILTLSAEAAVVNATWNAATDVAVTASSYTASGNTVNFTLNFVPPTGTNLPVVNNTGLPFISGVFDNLAQGQAVALSYGGVTYNYVAHYYGGTGNDLVLVWANQRVFAWGSNNYGEVGDGTVSARKIMVPVTTTGVLAGKTIVALENNGSCGLALCSDGTVAAWGSNSYGNLGNGTYTDSPVPVIVNTASGVSALYGKKVVAIAAGGCCMALCSDGTVATWGYNSFGNLGNNTIGERNVPVAVNTTSGVSALYGKTVVAIAAGSYNCMALCSDGTLASWGQGNFGQLGNGGTTDSLVPVQVSAVNGTSSLYGKTVSAIAVGSYFSMAACTDGTVSAWGDNSKGQLGINSTASKSVPVAVNTTNGVSALYNKTVVSVAAGYSHALGLCSDGTVAAWGSNTYGQLGDNSTTQRNVPVLVNTANGTSALYGKTVLAITTGGNNYYVSRALCTDGTLASWGLNAYNNLGNNSSTSCSVPVAAITTPLAAGERVVNPANGWHAAQSATLVAEPPPTLTTQAASLISSTSATLNGTANPNGGAITAFFEYGLTTAYGSTVTAAPAPVSGSSATAVSAALTGLAPLTTYNFRIKGGTYLGSDQTFTTLNNNASLGSLSLSSGTLSPALAAGTTFYTASVSSSTNNITVTPAVADPNASVTVNGSAVASGGASPAIDLVTGDNAISVVVTAQDGTTTKAYKIVVTRLFSGALPAAWASASDVPLSSNGFGISGGTVNLTLNFAPATGTNLTVVNNTSLGFITGAFDNLPHGQTVTLSYGGVTYRYVASYYGGTGNDLVLVWAGQRLVAWGDNTYGKVGDGTTTRRTTPVPVTATGVLWGKTILALADGFYHSMALFSDGTVATWGFNSAGQLGNNSTTSSYVPVLVSAASGVSALYGKTVVAIAAGYGSSMALCSDGTVTVWGGAGGSSVPVAVNAASGSALYGKSVVGIAAGAQHYLALCSDGTVVTWGVNSYGQLGNGTTTNSSVPVSVSTAGVSALNGKTVVAISAGREHSLALCSDGTMVSWGSNSWGQLGTGTDRSVPGAVSTVSGTSALYGKTVSAIAGGYNLSMALCTDGTVAVWGDGGHGQLGNGTNNISFYPVAVSTASGLSALNGRTVASIAIQGSNGTSLRALCTDGTLACWGVDNGNLGNGNPVDRNLPTFVYTSMLGLSEFAVTPSLSTNTAQSMALMAEPLPAVTTTTTGSLTGTSANLYGTVDARNGSFMVFFDYGLTPAYGSRIASVPDRAWGSGTGTYTATPTGLTPHTTYHYRINANGFTGADQTFTTLNNDASLSAMDSSAGSPSPALASGTLSYTLPGVSSMTTSITVTPTLTDSNAHLAINGVGRASGTPQPVNLVYGGNVISVQVTAEDGVTQQTYSVSVHRALPSTVAADFGSPSVVPLTVKGLNASGGNVNLSLSYAPMIGTNLTVISNTSSDFISGPFDNLAHGQTVTLSYNGSSYRFAANYYGGTGNDLVLMWADNRIYSWGTNTNGVVGDGTTTDRALMVPVTSTGVLAGRTIIALASGSQHNLALCADGTVAAWGLNSSGQLGNNSTTSSSVPVAVNTASGVSALYGKTVAAIAAGASHSLALCSDGTLVSWGGSIYGALGGSSLQSNVPAAVKTAGTSALYGKTVMAVCAGSYHSMALCTDGTVVAWGMNIFGQLGNNSTTGGSLPVAVNTASGVSALYGKTVVAVSAGYGHSLALCSDSSIAAWGNASTAGALGDGYLTTQSTVPVGVNVSTGSALYNKGVKAIAAGYNHSLALCNDGTVVAWGANDSGQLGNNSTTARMLPTAVNITSGVSALAGKTVVSIAVHDASGQTSRALCSDGTLATWGSSTLNYLGTGSAANSLVPAAVVSTSLLPGEKIIPVGGPSGTTTLSMILVAEPAPAVTTLEASAPGSTSMTLNGTVNASNGRAVAVTFNYGTTTAYGSTVVATPASVTGGTTTAVSATLAGLSPLTTYHFQANAAGYSGADQVFTTLNNDATLSALSVSSGTLSPAFASSTLGYNMVLDSSVTSITLTPIANDSLVTSITINGQVVLSGTASAAIPLVPGSNLITILVTAQDGSTQKNYTVSIACLSEMEQWRQRVFGSAANTGPTADTADYDSDGICNLLEYALSLDPKTAGKLPMGAAVNGANLEYTYTRSTSAVNAGTAYTVEWNPSLSAGSWSSAGVTQTVLSDDGTTQQVKAVIPVNGDASSMFVHLSVTAPP